MSERKMRWRLLGRNTAHVDESWILEVEDRVFIPSGLEAQIEPGYIGAEQINGWRPLSALWFVGPHGALGPWHVRDMDERGRTKRDVFKYLTIVEAKVRTMKRLESAGHGSDQSRNIAFVGKVGTGKSAATARLVGRGYRRVAFADPIKSMLSAIVPDERFLYGSQEDKEEIIPELGVSGRTLMTTLGDAWGRDLISKSLWVGLLVRGLEGRGPVVVDDVRRVNEAKALQDAGFMIIKLERAARPETTAESHASETDVDLVEVEMTIQNDGTLDELLSRIDRLLI